ncbi:hypothetical protein JX580_04100 [Thiomicrospira microaerophila]|uniref:hypothetical protein n=1 Tax=Thiomicrospira microaerophila TaxID=406020 RepID=UPI00200E30C2|nr:hypothetical protein [Thiomicrospira microaerophila]UQB43071.1 hypothetical protein JX580_04100 [Thiomicrospira microaerophila]
MSNRKSRQRGFASILFTGLVVVFMTGIMFSFEAGDKMNMQLNLKQYAEEIARSAMASELSITKKMIEEGQGLDRTSTRVNAILNALDYQRDHDIGVEVLFGTLEQGEFVVLAEHAEHPRGPNIDLDNPPIFSAVKVTLTYLSSRFPWSKFDTFIPTASVIFGLESDITEDRCGLRFDACLVDDSTIPSAMSMAAGAPGSTQRINYCRYGFAPSASGSLKYQNIRAENGVVLPESMWSHPSSPAMPWQKNGRVLDEVKRYKNCPILAVGADVPQVLGGLADTVNWLLGIDLGLLTDPLADLLDISLSIDVPTPVSSSDYFYIGEKGSCRLVNDRSALDDSCLFYDRVNYTDAGLSVCLLGITDIDLFGPDSTMMSHSCLSYVNNSSLDPIEKRNGNLLSLFLLPTDMLYSFDSFISLMAKFQLVD